MNLGIGLGLTTGTPPTGAPGPSTPVFVGLVSTSSGADPTLPVGWEPGDLLIATACQHTTNSGVAPSLDAPWNQFASLVGGSNYASAGYWTVADAGTVAPVWSGGTQPKSLWAFRSAVLDGGQSFAGNEGASITVPTLTLTTSAIIGFVVMSRAAQADITTDLDPPLAALGIARVFQKTGLPANWGGDSSPSLVPSYTGFTAPLSGVTSGYAGVQFAVRGA